MTKTQLSHQNLGDQTFVDYKVTSSFENMYCYVQNNPALQAICPPPHDTSLDKVYNVQDDWFEKV